MKKFSMLLCVIVTHCLQQPLGASQETLVNLTHVDVQGPAGQAGTARIQIESSDVGISAVVLTAFGRSVTLSRPCPKSYLLVIYHALKF